MHHGPVQSCIDNEKALEFPSEVEINRHNLQNSSADLRHAEMKQINPATPAGDENSHVADHRNPLPGSADVWQKCSLGNFQDWPTELRGYVLTVTALPYPAAIFWAENLTLLHNQSWAYAGGLEGQGQDHETVLTAETRNVIGAVKTRGIPKELQGHDLFRNADNATQQSMTAIVSPLLGNSKAGSKAVLVQLLPRPMLGRSVAVDTSKPETESDGMQWESNGGSTQQIDNAPLDEHPFFRRFAEMLPSGLAILDHNARAVFVNQHFYDLTTMLDGDDKSFTSWPQSIHPEDYERVMGAYKEAFNEGRELRTEFRARGEPHPWRLLLLTPLDDENLKHVSLQEGGGFICSIVDISSEKSAEINERKAAQQARERKEQQERFIDMISHEIRNPLSAVLHCAEDIGDAIRDKSGNEIDTSIIAEAVETITLCVSHQKNIVDDVLSFSKLDASLLSLHPKPANPSHQLAQSLKMFQHEFRKEKMQFGYRIDETYQEAHVRSVLADMPRIAQVLINLITNAIKFTRKSDGEKKIVCSVAASIERPNSYPPDVVFFQSENLAYRMDATNTQEWGNGDPVYIMVAVKDTGIGISAEGQQKLFERFRQATPKTEEVYGGSGLGLNISRKICHLHGGEIGVSAKEGEGSTFAFFFKVKRCDLDAETADGLLDEEQMREQIKNLGFDSPSELERTEPFDWTPESKRRRPEMKPSKLSQHHVVTSKDVEDEVRDQSPDEYAIAQRPEVSRAHLSKEKLESKEVQNGGQNEAETKKRPIADMKGEGARAHVLLVEDNIVNQRIVFRKLEAKGFNVTTANNGQEAVDAVKRAPKLSSGDRAAFDVILMDQEMPVMDGNTASKQIRALGNDKTIEHIPILGVTANVRGAQKDEMLESGMQDVISKPYKIDDMVNKIESVIKHASAEQEAAKKLHPDQYSAHQLVSVTGNEVAMLPLKTDI